MAIKSFIFNNTFRNYGRTIQDPETRLRFYEDVFNYGLDGVSPDTPIDADIWEDVTGIIDLQRIRRANGYKGGRPKKNSEGRGSEGGNTQPSPVPARYQDKTKEPDPKYYGDNYGKTYE